MIASAGLWGGSLDEEGQGGVGGHSVALVIGDAAAAAPAQKGGSRARGALHMRAAGDFLDPRVGADGNGGGVGVGLCAGGGADPEANGSVAICGHEGLVAAAALLPVEVGNAGAAVHDLCAGRVWEAGGDGEDVGDAGVEAGHGDVGGVGGHGTQGERERWDSVGWDGKVADIAGGKIGKVELPHEDGICHGAQSIARGAPGQRDDRFGNGEVGGGNDGFGASVVIDEAQFAGGGGPAVEDDEGGAEGDGEGGVAMAEGEGGDEGVGGGEGWGGTETAQGVEICAAGNDDLIGGGVRDEQHAVEEERVEHAGVRRDGGRVVLLRVQRVRRRAQRRGEADEIGVLVVRGRGQRRRVRRRALRALRGRHGGGADGLRGALALALALALRALGAEPPAAAYMCSIFALRQRTLRPKLLPRRCKRQSRRSSSPSRFTSPAAAIDN